jgi:DNA-binding SARP family transcriptional activator/Flp pilus assembly protein TadD
VEVTAANHIRIRLLGSLAVFRGDAPVALPASRKLRALLAHLALAPRPVGRSELCALLWDGPDDPRAELRWCLTRLRAALDDGTRRRVVTREDTVALALDDCDVDARDVAAALQAPGGLPALDPSARRALLARCGGVFLDGLELEGCPAFDAWVGAQRRAFREAHTGLLELLATAEDAAGTESEIGAYLEQWLALAPFDPRVHRLLLDRLARQGRIAEGDAHLATTARRFADEGLDATGIRAAWREARAAAERPNFAVPKAAADATVAAPSSSPAAADPARRASIAVMPFADRSARADPRGGVADALAHDVITRLAKLRSLFVIAEGTVFALHDRHVAPAEAGRMLSVDYLASGTVRRDGPRLHVQVELVDTRTSRIVWSEAYDERADDAFRVLDAIGDRIVASVASEVESIERNRAILKAPESLDAWESHHRGLWHMYRFNRADNALALEYFERAVRLDPTFSRAHAGISFAHFQNAFQGWVDRRDAVERAHAAAAQSLMADDRDPAAHWAMGRALWLRGREAESIGELDHAVALSPNFAQGHYTLAFVHSQGGDPEAAITASDHSRSLSPFDPLLFGMLGARAMALVRLGRYDEAAEWGMRAAMRPNAHEQILAIAGYSLALAGRPGEGREHLAAIRAKRPDYGVEHFLTAMRFPRDAEKLWRDAARRIDAH